MRRLGLSRVYFEAFGPHPARRLVGATGGSAARACLYQASYLLRTTASTWRSWPSSGGGLHAMWIEDRVCQAALAHSPVEVNRAPRERLLRVPGIGPLGRCAAERPTPAVLRSLDQLHRLASSPSGRSYITLDGQALAGSSASRGLS